MRKDQGGGKKKGRYLDQQQVWAEQSSGDASCTASADDCRWWTGPGCLVATPPFQALKSPHRMTA